MANFYAVYSPSDAGGISAIVSGSGSAGVPASGVVTVQGISGGQPIPVSGTITEINPSIGLTNTTTPGSATLIGGTDGTNMRVPHVSAGGLMSVDASGVTVPVSGTFWQGVQPVSGTVAATQSGSWTVAVNDFPASQTVNGTVTANQGSPNSLANYWPVAITDGTTKAAVSGTGAVKVDGSAVTQPISGTVTSNIGTTNGLALDATLTKLNVAQGAVLDSNTGPLIQGSVNVSAPSYSGGNINPLSLTTAGALRVDASGSTQPISGTVAATQSGTWTVQPGNTANTTPWLSTINQGGNSATVTAGNALKVDGSAVTQPVSGAFFQATQPVSGTVAVSSVAGSVAVTGTFFQATQPVSGTVTANAGSGTMNVVGTGTAGSSGSAVLTIQGIAGGTAVPISGSITATNASVSTTGSAVPASATMVGGTDGTNLRALKVSSTGVLSVDGSAVTQPVSGTITANAGTGTFTTSTSVATATFQDGSIAFGSLTTSFATVITTGGVLKHVDMRNNTNAVVVVSLNSGSTTSYTLDAGDFVSLDLAINGSSIASSTTLQAKYTGTAPTSGSIRINAFY